jgi:2-oxoglutarate ferredoxin oxidoreductase subunit gamma
MESGRDDIDVISIPASDMATEMGNPRMANVILLGAFIDKTGIVSLETVEAQLEAHISERHKKWLEPNKEALHTGAALAREA